MNDKMAVGKVTRTPLKKQEVMDILAGCKTASVLGKTQDGTRLHIEYHHIPNRESTDLQKEEAQRANDLELKMDRYTGRLDNVRVSKDGDTIIVLFVELERDHKYRSFNIDQGEVHKLVVLGD